jgi:hypothetical protein
MMEEAVEGDKEVDKLETPNPKDLQEVAEEGELKVELVEAA